MVSAMAIVLQGGWSVKGNQKTYTYGEPGGSQSIARMLAGLDPASTDFALLPPRFRVDVLVPLEEIYASDDLVRRLVRRRVCFSIKRVHRCSDFNFQWQYCQSVATADATNWAR